MPEQLSCSDRRKFARAARRVKRLRRRYEEAIQSMAVLMNRRPEELMELDLDELDELCAQYLGGSSSFRDAFGDVNEGFTIGGNLGWA